MIAIHYPSYDFNIKSASGKDWIFDPVRKKWVTLTPEEWVRQHFLQYLIQVMQYPAALIAVEKEIAMGDIKKRFDILVYHQQVPWLIVECKERNVPLTQQVFDQVLNYHRQLQTRYLIATNGDTTLGIAVTNGIAATLTQLPAFGA